MKILVINHEFPPLGGGGGVFSRDLALAWQALGHEVIVLTSKDQELPAYEAQEGVEIYRVFAGSRSKDKASFFNLLFFSFSAFFRGLELIRLEKIELLDTHFALPAGLVGYFLQVFTQKPNILHLHGADIYDPSRLMSGHRFFPTRFLIRRIIKKATQVVTSTPEIEGKTQQYFKIKKKINILPLGFQLKAIQKRFPLFIRPPLPKPGEPLRFVTVGRLVARKNLNLLLEVWAKLDPSKVKLTIVGDGPQLSLLKKTIVRLKLKNVSLTGRVSESQKYTLLSQGHVFISSALHEGFGLVFLEAMAFGLPIIASSSGGQTYFLKEGQNALFFKNNEAQSLQAVLERLLSNPQLVTALGANNQKLVEDFAIEHIAKEYLDLIK